MIQIWKVFGFVISVEEEQNSTLAIVSCRFNRAINE